MAGANLPRPTSSDKSAEQVAQRDEVKPLEQETKQPRFDPQVKPAAAIVASPEPTTEERVLPVDEPLYIEQLDLKPNMRVRGRAGKRPTIHVPARGLLVDVEGVCFEGVDFVWSHRGAGQPASGGAMIRLEAQTVTFRRCSFAARGGPPPVAIASVGSANGLPGLGDEVALFDCVADGVAAVIDHAGGGELTASLSNSLCIAAGPVVCLHRPPRSGESINIVLDHVTTRGDTSVLECRYGRHLDGLGTISVTANESALASSAATGLIVLAGVAAPQKLVATLNWTGQGSIVTPHTPVLVWSNGRNRQPLPDEELPFAGLVRSALEFAAAAQGPPAASRVTRWQVPLRSAEPPGANPDLLSLPTRALTSGDR